jgi:hypothetical protein
MKRTAVIGGTMDAVHLFGGVGYTQDFPSSA